jgi:hypothetical protein
MLDATQQSNIDSLLSLKLNLMLLPRHGVIQCIQATGWAHNCAGVCCLLIAPVHHNTVLQQCSHLCSAHAYRGVPAPTIPPHYMLHKLTAMPLCSG